jgi:hypothetical protein
MQDWYKGFVSGALATIFGFILTMVWDLVKYRREAGQKDNAILNAVKGEISTNTAILTKNQASIQHELTIMNEGQYLIHPLHPLQQGL